MLLNGRCILAILIVCLSLGGCASARKVYMAENLQLGRLTFESGDFKRAFCQLLPLAVEGSPQAQYAVGYMYYYGYGVSRDTVSGLFWIKRSADRYYPPAIKALIIIEKCEGEKDKDPPPHSYPVKQAALTEHSAANYTLQLLGSYDLAAVKVEQNKLNMDSIYRWRTIHHNKNWYILTYGKYPALYQATLARDDLPKKLRNFNPWPRRISGLEVV